MEDLKYNYFTVYLTDYSEENKAYKFFKKGLKCFTDSKSIIHRTDSLMTTKEFEETIIKGTKYSHIVGKVSVSDLHERIKALLEEVSYLNKLETNKKVIIDWDEFPLVTKPELGEEMMDKLNKFVEVANKPMKEIEINLFAAFLWSKIDSYSINKETSKKYNYFTVTLEEKLEDFDLWVCYIRGVETLVPKKDHVSFRFNTGITPEEFNLILGKTKTSKIYYNNIYDR